MYTYPMKSKNLLRKKIELFFGDISKRSDLNKKMRIQTDQEFKQNEIKKVNKIYNTMLKCSVQKLVGEKHLLRNKKLEILTNTI